MTSLLEAVRQIEDAETQTASVAEALLHLHELGALRPSDVQRYDVLRIQLLGAQFAAYGQIVAVARAVPGVPLSLFSQLPVPQLAPRLPVAPNFFPTSTPPSPSVSGLGNPIVIAVGGVSISFPVWAAIVVVLIIAIAAVAAFTATLQVYTASEQIDANAHAVATYYQTVLRVIQQCRASGGTPAQCATLAEGIQTPQTVMPQGPQNTPPGGDLTAAAKWLALGAVGLFGAILVTWTAIRSSNTRGRDEPRSSRAPRYLLAEG